MVFHIGKSIRKKSVLDVQIFAVDDDLRSREVLVLL